LADSPDIATLEQLLTRHRPFIAVVVKELARRHHLSPDEVREFERQVETALERNDYELIRAFEGGSTWATYLSTIVARLCVEFQAARWGSWRPSARATREGPTGILLEELMVRDGLSLDAAIDVMRFTHRVDVPRRKLQALAETLELTAAAPSSVPHDTQGAQPSVDSAAIEAALRIALDAVSSDDRLMLAMRFLDRVPVTRIARVMRQEPRPFQRHFDEVTSAIRQSLLSQGIPAVTVEHLLDDVTAGNDTSAEHKWWEAVLPRLSN
jgi:DNA-directed RNA polymerase specialized sigma24 family protein